MLHAPRWQLRGSTAQSVASVRMGVVVAASAAPAWLPSASTKVANMDIFMGGMRRSMASVQGREKASCVSVTITSGYDCTCVRAREA